MFSFLTLLKTERMCKVRQLSPYFATLLPRFLEGDGHARCVGSVHITCTCQYSIPK